jgi:hypothetical protein
MYALPCFLCWVYIRVVTAVARAPHLFPIFCATFCFRLQQPHTLNKMHYPADKDVGRGTWFQEMMGQVPKPKYCQCLKSHKEQVLLLQLSSCIFPIQDCFPAPRIDVLVNGNGLLANHATAVKCQHFND